MSTELASENFLHHVEEPVNYITAALDESMSVEASAGCGKTFALIARVCELLKSGRTSIERLLLLTFTDNAAAEMKHRLVDVLKKHDSEPWAQRALENLNLASIQTIHSFAYEICKQFHDSLGLPDEIAIVDAIDQQKILDAFFNSHYNEWGNNSAMLPFFKICKVHHAGRVQLRDALRQIVGKITHISGDTNNENASTDFSSIAHIVKISAVKLREAAVSYMQLVSLENLDVIIPQNNVQRIPAFSDFAHAIIETHNDLDLYKLINYPQTYIGSKTFDLKTKASFNARYVEIEGAIAELGRVRQDFIQNTLDATLRFIIDKLYALAVDYREATFSSGSITFDDSVIAARRAIENELIREQLWARYDSIIVDEFQDTDIHQLAILDSLADEASLGELARLFVVGDDKQSIYGFRGATVDGYKNFVRTRPLKRIALDLSRRSVPAVIDCINEISAPLIDEYLPMKGTRENLNDSPHYHVKVMGESLDLKVDEVRELQAQECIQELKRMQGKSLIYDKNIKETRPCEYSDMTILIRDKNSLPSVIQALETLDLPYSIDSSALVWELTMIRTLLALLKASSSPRDGFAVIAALKTPVFQITNDELSDYVEWMKGIRNGKETSSTTLWDYRYIKKTDSSASEIPSAVQKVVSSLAALKEMHQSLPFLTPYHFLHQILFDKGFFQSFVVILGESHSLSVMHFILSDVIAYQDSHPMASVANYVEHLERSRNDSVKSDSFIESSDHTRIRVMTIHASKGLEFPIVAFLPSHMETKDRRISVVDLNPQLANASSFALSISSKNYDSRLADHKDAMKDRFLEEESRLIYVALTRAQDHLIIGAHHKTVKKPSNQVSLVALGAQNIERYTSLIDLPDWSTRKTGVQLSIDIDERLHSLSELFNHIYTTRSEEKEQLNQRIVESKSVNATSMKPDEIVPSKIEKRKISIFDTSAAPSIGRAVHRVMNIIDFDASYETVVALCARCGANEGIVSESGLALCVDMVTRALSIPLLHSQNIEIMREVPISGFIEGVFCEGYIDCLIKSNNDYIIVDYKTDSIDEHRPLEDKVRVHSFQLAFYSLLLKQVTHVEKCSAALLFLNHKDMPFVTIENLEENEELVRKKLSQ